MVEKQDNVYFYLTLLNENYAMPGLTPGTEEQIIKGMYLCKPGASSDALPRVQLLGSGTILRELIAAAGAAGGRLGRGGGRVELRRASTSWPATASDAERWSLLHPTDDGPRAVRGAAARRHAAARWSHPPTTSRPMPSRSGSFIPKGRTYKVLGTDGFGRSDFRTRLREHFEVNRHYIVVAALKALSEDGVLPASKVAEAIKKYGIRADRVNPLYA